MKLLASILKIRSRLSPALPVIFQVTNLDCGLACLAMVFRHHGRLESLEAIRAAVPGSASETTAKSLIRGGLAFGFAARAVRVRLPQVAQVRLPAILHWNFNHFVVLERVCNSGYLIADPSSGRRLYSTEEFSDLFTGIAVEFWPGADFEPSNNIVRLSISNLWTSTQGFKTSVALLLAVSLCAQILNLLSPLMLSVLVDRVSVYRSVDLLYLTAAATISAVLLGSGGELLRRWLLLSIGNQVNAQISLNFVGHLFRLPYRFFQERRINDLMSRVESIRSIKDTLVNESVPAIMDGLFSIATLLVIFILSPLLAAVVLFSSTIYAVARVFAFAPQKSRFDRALETAGVERGAVMESVRGIQTIKVLSAEWARMSIWHGANRDANAALQRQNQLASLMASLRGLITSADLVFTISLAMTLVLRSHMSLGVLFAVVALRQQFQERMFGLIDRSFEFGMIRLHLARTADVTRARPELNNSPKSPFRANLGHIRVDGLAYRYTPDRPWIFRGVSFEVMPGEFVAISGASGEGKTTLARLLLGLLPADEGSIYIDDQTLDATSITRFRAITAAVLQDDQLFSGTILENICAFDPDMAIERAIECAKSALIHEDILMMATGYYSRIGDMGSALSGGQKQRILLARALYQRPKILFLDEGTANLDVEREARIIENLKRLNLTLICIAHRSATLEAADRVLSLRGGSLHEIDCDLGDKARGTFVRALTH